MKLFYRKFGTGPCLVILHGLYGSSDNWVTIARKISDKFTVILPDLRNHGQSPHSTEHNYDLMSADIAELIREIGIRKFLLAGHSMGGKVAMNFAFTWPEMLEGLIVIDISPFGSTDQQNKFFRQHKEILDSIISLDIKNLSSRTDIENLLALKIKSERTRGFLMKNLTRDGDGKFLWKLNAISLHENLPGITESIIKENMLHLQVTGFPVYFLRGEESDYIDPDGFGAIRAIFPACELVNIKNAGHWLHADQPEEVVNFFLRLI